MGKFADLGIGKDFEKGLMDLNIIEPTAIQKQVIPLLMAGSTDLVGQAQTGTGKTAAFGLPLLHKIDPKVKKVQALILCPTRELGMQIAKQLFRFTKYSDKIFTEAVYGGEKIDIQIGKLARPTHIIVATPGRLIDLIKRKVVDLYNVKTVVLDEADEMLSMGFKKDLEKILSYCKNANNKWLFSATMPQGIQQIVKDFLAYNAHKVEISTENATNELIDHQYVVCDEKEKLGMLLHFLKAQGKNRGVIFCKTKAATQKLALQLIAKNVASDAIHGDLQQKERDKVMRAFKNESLQFLVATDLAARGIDIDSLSFVVHYQMPDHAEYYTHRSGRTARAGKKGVSLSIVDQKELKSLRFFEKTLGFILTQAR